LHDGKQRPKHRPQSSRAGCATRRRSRWSPAWLCWPWLDGCSRS